MPDDARQKAFSLRRWSQRKLAAARRDEAPRADDRPGTAAKAGTTPADGSPSPPVDTSIASPRSVPASDTTIASPRPCGDATATPSHDVVPGAGARTALPASAGTMPLPALESLTIDSDFSPFMQPGVDEELKRNALRKLLRHPRFNVMDGLDTYIDDYSIPSPLEPELVRTLNQARYLFNPPKTRVTEDGIVEDVPDEATQASDAVPNDSESATVLPAPGAGEVRGDGNASEPLARAGGAPATTPGIPDESNSA